MPDPDMLRIVPQGLKTMPDQFFIPVRMVKAVLTAEFPVFVGLFPEGDKAYEIPETLK